MFVLMMMMMMMYSHLFIYNPFITMCYIWYHIRIKISPVEAKYNEIPQTADDVDDEP